ncbi:MAG: hypothetical protein HY708_01430 [Ignavibacteriae bacterium]|nr:hypothetical protein [Ignavibacteriota bacterium]
MTNVHRLRDGCRGFLFVFFLVFLFLPAVSSAQITVQTLAAPVNTLSINDIDFLRSTTPKWLFTITMNTDGEVNAVMTITLDVALANSEIFDNAVVLLTKVFTINGTRTVTNLDLGNGRAIPDSQYTFNSDARRRFEEIALPGGSMPDGEYRFNVVVIAVGSSISNGSDFTIVLSNPSSPVLLSPAESEGIPNEYPLFQWQYDGLRSMISVFEQLPGQTSMEETASGVPHLSETVTTTSFQYPTAGVRPLQSGKTYVWAVTGLASTSGGTNVSFRSALRSFTVSPGGGAALQSLLDEIERSLPAKYKPLFDQIRADGLSPSGTIRLNGSQISSTEMLQLLSQLRTKPDIINSVGLE